MKLHSQVQIKNVIRTGHCSSVTDPHIITFDRKYYYHLYEPGNFILVKSSSSRLFEVSLVIAVLQLVCYECIIFITGILKMSEREKTHTFQSSVKLCLTFTFFKIFRNAIC